MKVLVIQTAFIGDAILSTSILETLKAADEISEIHLLVRKGNESLFQDHPFLAQLHVWDKKAGKYSELRKLAREIRKQQFDCVFNLQRFGSTGWLTWRSGASRKVGFAKNPFSWTFDVKVDHPIAKKGETGLHEIERNHAMLAGITNTPMGPMKLYPGDQDFQKVEPFVQTPFVTMSPASVWFTKQLPLEQWANLMDQIPEVQIYLLGGPGDEELCQRLAGDRANVKVLAGELSLLQSAALMSKAQMNYVNDSAPLHLCSAMCAPVTAFFCSTIPEFGFGPRSNQSVIAQTTEDLECRPCGLHGLKACPKGHFKCGTTIDVGQYLPS